MRTLLSQDRFRTYQTAAGHDDHRAVKLYLWNIAVGQSLKFPLHILEVALRNRVDWAFATATNPNWLIAQPTWLQQKAEAEISKASTKLSNALGRPPAQADLIAALSFGFWAALLASRYAPNVWSQHLARAFPSKPPSTTLKQIAASARKLNVLRNRIFHHEPVLNRNLAQDYADAVRMIGYICPTTAQWVRAHASLPTILRQKP